MKFTILTPSYNQAQYLEENILSVLNQRGVEIEHIVIDGGSTDNTMEILKKYPHLKWVSEKDEGQADALRKGLKMATGEIIGWINSDDYLEKDILKTIHIAFEANTVDWVVGNISYLFDNEGKIQQDKSIPITKQSLIKNPDILRQQGTFFRKEPLIKAGGFDKFYQQTMDLDLWFRMLKLSIPQMIDRNVAYFRIHKDQKTSGKHIRLQTKEILKIFDKNGVSEYYKLRLRWRKYYFRNYLNLVQIYKKIRSTWNHF